MASRRPSSTWEPPCRWSKAPSCAHARRCRCTIRARHSQRAMTFEPWTRTGAQHGPQDYPPRIFVGRKASSLGRIAYTSSALLLLSLASPRLASPHLGSLASPQLTSPRLLRATASPRLASPRLASQGRHELSQAAPPPRDSTRRHALLRVSCQPPHTVLTICLTQRTAAHTPRVHRCYALFTPASPRQLAASLGVYCRYASGFEAARCIDGNISSLCVSQLQPQGNHARGLGETGLVQRGPPGTPQTFQRARAGVAISCLALVLHPL